MNKYFRFSEMTKREKAVFICDLIILIAFIIACATFPKDAPPLFNDAANLLCFGVIAKCIIGCLRDPSKEVPEETDEETAP